MIKILNSFFLIYDSPYFLLQKLLPLIYSLPSYDPFINIGGVKKCLDHQNADQHFAAIQGFISIFFLLALTTSEISLLVILFRVRNIRPPITFGALYEEYRTLSSRSFSELSELCTRSTALHV